jgi:hypothetical protein
MPSVLAASKLNLHDVETKWHLQQTAQGAFAQWLQETPNLSDLERQILDRTRQQYLYLAKRPLLEVTVKMVVISPLLSLAGFYDPPFYTTLEEPVEIESQDGSETVRGQIDVLVLRNPLSPTAVWVAIVEAKSIQYDVMTALPQALVYMMAGPSCPLFGLLSNGREFCFVQLEKEPISRYSLSRVFSLSEPENQLYEVLRLLKFLAQKALGSKEPAKTPPTP